MSSVLDGLDQVDWARLTHAYGTATDVPEQIRALLSPTSDDRVDALQELYGNIFHQGTVYEATAHAVPFLLEVLTAPGFDDQPQLLGLLTSIVVAYDELWLPAGLPIAEHRRAADDERLAAYDAVRAGVPLYRELLTSEPPVQCMAAYALAWFPEEAPESLRALASVTEGDPEGVVAATASITMGLLGSRPTVTLDDPRPLARWGAAIALANVDGPGASQDVVDELLAVAGGSLGTSDRVPFLEGDLAGYAARALRQVGEAHADRTFDVLVARTPSVSGSEAFQVVKEALRMAFPAGTLPPSTPYYALDRRQRRIVDALAQSPGTWLIDGVRFANFSSLVRSYGLPFSRDALLAYAETR